MKSGFVPARIWPAAMGVALGAAPLSAEAQDEAGDPAHILAILAHPDDEITIAPVLAKAARSGASVTLVFATSGDAGPGVSGLEPGARLAALREGEARCSAAALGIGEPRFWRMGDGTLAPMARMPGSAATSLIARIGTLVEDTRPDLVLTWGPDGGYGHSDHRMVSAAVTQVLAAMDDERPDLLYSAIPAQGGAAPPRALKDSGFEDWARTDPALITRSIAYEDADLAASRAALACHESQFPAEIRAALVPMLDQLAWRGAVHFRAAFAPSAKAGQAPGRAERADGGKARP